MVRQDSFQSIVTRGDQTVGAAQKALNQQGNITLRSGSTCCRLLLGGAMSRQPADNAREIHAGLTLGTGLDRIRVKRVHSMYDYRMLPGMSLPETDCVPRPFV